MTGTVYDLISSCATSLLALGLIQPEEAEGWFGEALAATQAHVDGIADVSERAFNTRQCAACVFDGFLTRECRVLRGCVPSLVNRPGFWSVRDFLAGAGPGPEPVTFDPNAFPYF